MATSDDPFKWLREAYERARAQNIKAEEAEEQMLEELLSGAQTNIDAWVAFEEAERLAEYGI